jgi:hypothetical protein
MYNGADAGTTLAGLALVPPGLLEPQPLTAASASAAAAAAGSSRVEQNLNERAGDNAVRPFSGVQARQGRAPKSDDRMPTAGAYASPIPDYGPAAPLAAIAGPPGVRARRARNAL